MSETVSVTHLGLIIDGNRRWAKANNLPTLEGHRKGYVKLKEIAKYAINNGIEYVSAYIFSTENWNRTKTEVKYLMRLAYQMATKEVDEVHKENIRVRFLGNKQNLDDKLIQAIEKAEQKTKDNSRGTLALCFNYGGQQEIADAVRQIVTKNVKPEAITPELIEQNLYSADIPPIDLLIRTSGEQRLSGFMMWRTAYSELYFTNKYWPDFTTADLDDALVEFTKRERRMGS